MPGQKRIPISHNNIATSPGLEKRKMVSVDCKAISGSSVIDFYFSDSSLRSDVWTVPIDNRSPHIACSLIKYKNVQGTETQDRDTYVKQVEKRISYFAKLYLFVGIVHWRSEVVS